MALIACLTMLLAPVTAQRPAVQTPVKPPAPGTPTFKANANLVIIDVSAKDKGGLAVEGDRKSVV